MAMRYTSTRDKTINVSFEEAVVCGVPPNRKGGEAGWFVPLFPPEKVTREELKEWRELPLSSLAFRVARRFIGPEDVPDDVLKGMMKRSYETLEVGWINGVGDSMKCDVAELYQCPSLAFKDWGMRPALELLDYFWGRKRKQQQQPGKDGVLNVLVCTSGDTGPSLLESCRGLYNVRACVLFPSGRVSSLQAAQMRTTLQDDPSTSDNARVYEVEGADSDALDLVSFRAFGDSWLRESLGTMNSINIARIVFGVVHWFAVIFRALDVYSLEEQQEKKIINVAVPCGALGNLYAGLLALKMGLPCVNRLLVATNENDIASCFFSTGKFVKAKESAKPTISPAMDIVQPYNLERCVHLLSGWNADETRVFMLDYEMKGKASFDVSRFNVPILSARVSEAEIIALCKQELEKCNRLLDSHTAVGVCAALRSISTLTDDEHWICLGTAHPQKMAKELLFAMGQIVHEPRILSEKRVTRAGFRLVHLDKVFDILKQDLLQ